jgi:hypothetical protein
MLLPMTSRTFVPPRREVSDERAAHGAAAVTASDHIRAVYCVTARPPRRAVVIGAREVAEPEPGRGYPRLIRELTPQGQP